MANPRGNVATLKHYKPKWKSGATHVVRIPIAISDQVVNYAWKLDQGEIIQAKCSNQSLLQVIEKLNTVLQTPRNNFSKEKKALLQSAIDDINSLVTSDIF